MMKMNKMTAEEYQAINRVENTRAPKPRAKYNNTETEYDGMTFASKKEAERYVELKHKERIGEISELVCQPKFTLQPPFYTPQSKRIRAITYRADFKYHRTRDDVYVIEDVKSKGTITEAFRLRWKMLLYRYRDCSKFVCEIWD